MAGTFDYHGWIQKIENTVREGPIQYYVSLEANVEICNENAVRDEFEEQWQSRDRGQRTDDTRVELMFDKLRGGFGATGVVHTGYDVRAKIVPVTGTLCNRVRMNSFL